jgi:hypothetical protein
LVVARLDRLPRLRFKLKKQAHPLVDGYNVILESPQLKDALPRDKERSREALGRIARNVHVANGMRASLVFVGREVDHQIVCPGKELTVSFPFSCASFTGNAGADPFATDFETPV